jgi:flagellar basal-body rod protein FlgC
MNFMDAIRVSSSGLTVQRVRMNVIAGNLANINTTQTAQGGPYRKKDVLLEVSAAGRSFEQNLQKEIQGQMNEVQVADIFEDPRPPLTQFNPHHPDADENGFVAMPNINLTEEMVNLMEATRSYEANVTVIKASKDMALKALEIGR